jgi:uncharacterized protein YceK
MMNVYRKEARMRRLVRIGVVSLAVAAIALTGCDSLLQEDDGGGGGGTKYFSVRVINNSAVTITAVYIWPSSESDWGPNQLQGNTIAPGSAHTVTEIPVGTYDLRADSSGGDIATQMGIPFSEMAYDWTINSF